MFNTIFSEFLYSFIKTPIIHHLNHANQSNHSSDSFVLIIEIGQKNPLAGLNLTRGSINCFKQIYFLTNAFFLERSRRKIAPATSIVVVEHSGTFDGGCIGGSNSSGFT